MIGLTLQIYSIIYTYIYGVVCSFLVNLFYKLLFFKNKKWRVIFNLAFALFMSILYFILLKMINNGYIHIYFLFVFVLGFLSSFPFFKSKFRK